MSQGSRCSASGNGGLLIWGVSADVDMGELVDFFGADPVELEFTASSRRLAGSKTTSEPQKLWCAILGLNLIPQLLPTLVTSCGNTLSRALNWVNAPGRTMQSPAENVLWSGPVQVPIQEAQ